MRSFAKQTSKPARTRRIGSLKQSAQSVVVDGVVLSSPEKVLFPDSGITKEQVARYYAEVAPLMFEEIRRRPLMLLRFPQGIGAKGFFQKHFPVNDKQLRTVKIAERDGTVDFYATVNEPRDIVALAQRNVIEFHPWGSRMGALEYPDRLIFDLDPGPDVEAPAVIDLAKRFARFLERCGLQSFPRLSGGKGIHLVIPIVPREEWAIVETTAAALAKLFIEKEPDATVEIAKRKRIGKVFIDYLRNSRGATCVASYSLRARPGAPVALPVDWKELKRGSSFNRYTLEKVLQRVRKGVSPWKGFSSMKQRLPASKRS